MDKIYQLEKMLKEKDIDTLLVLSREDSDIVLPLFLDMHVVAQTAIFFNKSGNHIVLTGKTDANAYEKFNIFNIVTVKDNFNIEFKEIFDQISPKKLALNISQNDYLSDGLTMGQYLLLSEIIGNEKLKEIEISSEEIISTLRSIKSTSEIDKIAKAVDITCDIYDEVAEEIRVGMSETQIGELFVKGMKKYNVVNAFGSAYSYPLICINRCGLAHRIPNENNILCKGDILICDFSVNYKGYCSDVARSFYVLKDGEQSAPIDVQKGFDTAVLAVTEMINNIKIGMKGFEADNLGRKIIEEAGYPTIRHGAGHQLGKRVHDGGTTLSYYREDRPSVKGKIRENEVYAIEPTVIQDDGLPSFIVEENIVVTKDCNRVLSRRQLQLFLVRS